MDGIAVDLLFAAQPFTGLEHHGLHILRGLREAEVSVDVWVGRNVMPDLRKAAEGHQFVPFPPAPRPLRLGWEQWVAPWRFGIRPRSYRLLHSVIGVAPMLMRLPLVVTVPDLAYHVVPAALHPRARLYFGTFVPRSVRRARRIIVSSETVRRQVIDLYRIAPERVVSVPLCAEAIFQPQAQEAVKAIRKQFLLPERYVLYVGTVESRKDLRRLRAAYDLLPQDLADVALVFVGRTAYGAQALASELKRPPRWGHVVMLDYVPRASLPALYAGASVFVYPSRYEGFGLPVLEAMSCGVPVIVSDTGALRELVSDSGIVLRTPAADELTQAIERMLRFDEERRHYQELGLKRAADFTAKRLGMRTVEVYREALAA